MRLPGILFVGSMFLVAPVAAMALGDSSASPSPARVKLSLAESIALALENNRSLGNARLDREVQKLALEVAEDEFRPDVDLDSSLDYNAAWDADREQLDHSRRAAVSPRLTLRVPTGGVFTVSLNNAFDDLGTGDSYTSSPSVDFVQPLLRGGGVAVATANLRNARRQEEINVLAFRSNVISVVNSTVSAYWNLVRAGRQVEISERSLQRAREQLEVNRLLIRTGRMAARDAVQTEADIARRELSLTETRNSLDNARLGLVNVLDVDSRTQIEPTETLSVTPRTPDLARSLDRAYAHRPDYLRATLDLERVRTGVLVAENERLWDLSLRASASAGDTRESPGGALGGALGDVVNRGDYAVGLALRVPLYGDLARQQRSLAARTALLQAGHNLEELRQNIDIEVRAAVRDVEVRLRQVDLARRAEELAGQKIDIEREKLRLGLSTNFRLAAFEDDLVSTENGAVNAIIAYLNALTTLDRVLGTTLETWNIEIDGMDDQ